MLEKDGFTFNQRRNYLGDENAAWWRTLSDDQGIYVETVPIDQVVEPLYFKKCKMLQKVYKLIFLKT